jgi:hypothetical protein
MAWLTNVLRLPERLLEWERSLRERRRWFLGLVAALSIAGAWYCLGDLVHAKWGAVDDHEYAEMLGSKRNFKLLDYLSFVFRSDLFRPGQTGSRFRPSYWILRATELFVWGAHPNAWYFARILMFAFFLGGVVWVLRRRLSVVENALFCAYLASLVLWSDIFCRLGPAETYAVVGVIWFAAGFQSCWASARAEAPARRRWLGSAALFFGAFAAMGTKENMFFMAALCVPLVLRAGLRRENRPILIASLTSMAFALYVVVFTWVGLKKYGHVYSEDVTLDRRWVILKDTLDGLFATWRWPVLGTLLVAIALFMLGVWRRRPLQALVRETALAIGAVAGLALVWASQAAFYNGHWPILDPSQTCCGRYDFPGLLATPFIAYAAYAWLVAAAASSGVPPSATGWLRIAVVIWGALVVRDLTYPTQAAAKTTVSTSTRFSSKMRAFARTVSADPKPVIFESFQWWDQEIMVSVAGFMRLYGADVPYFIKLHYTSAGLPPGPREAAALTEKAAANGNWYGFRPWSEYHGEPCYAVGFSGAPQLPCAVLGTAP